MNAYDRPFSPAADSNRHAILHALRAELEPADQVLEIGSGSGQHACHFAAEMPEIFWQPSDLTGAIPGMMLWFEDADLSNLLPPIVLDVECSPWPEVNAAVCYTANTLHIISEPAVAALFAGCATVLSHGGKLIVYGPFSFGGQHVSASNARFSESLRNRNAASGVRDVTELNRIAGGCGFHRARALALASNNHLLVFDRPGSPH